MAGETAQQLSALVALVEDWSSVLSTHVQLGMGKTHKCL